MMLVEAAARGGAAALMLLIALQAFREARQSWAGRMAGVLALAAIAQIAVTSPTLAPLFTPALLPVRIIAFGTPALFWIWASALFDDAFEWRWYHPAILILHMALGAALVLTFSWAAILAYNLIALALNLMVFRTALIGRKADLIEPRRRFRLILTIAVAAYGVTLTIAELTMHGTLVSPPGSTVNAFCFLGLAFGFAAMRNAWLVPAASTAPSPARPASPDQPDPQEAALLAALRRAMTLDKAYRTEGFGIAALAGRIGVPEYRLRRLINQRLGYRNFTDFVNSYRLVEVLEALADPGQAAVPILTIALDAGFQSIGPFNRAFKARTGTTPTEYRRQRLGQAQSAEA